MWCLEVTDPGAWLRQRGSFFAMAAMLSDLRDPRSDLPRQALELIVSTWHPLEIWLYGSRAKGTHRPDSDWDLLLVVPDETDPALLDLVGAWGVTGALRPTVEVYPVLQREFDAGKRWLGSLAQIAATEGRRLYVR